MLRLGLWFLLLDDGRMGLEAFLEDVVKCGSILGGYLLRFGHRLKGCILLDSDTIWDGDDTTSGPLLDSTSLQRRRRIFIQCT